MPDFRAQIKNNRDFLFGAARYGKRVETTLTEFHAFMCFRFSVLRVARLIHATRDCILTMHSEYAHFLDNGMTFSDDGRMAYMGTRVMVNDGIASAFTSVSTLCAAPLSCIESDDPIMYKLPVTPRFGIRLL